MASSKDNHPAGYLWNTNLNSFTVNEVKLTLASPAVDKDKWDAAYRASFIWGSDAPVVDTGSTQRDVPKASPGCAKRTSSLIFPSAPGWMSGRRI